MGRAYNGYKVSGSRSHKSVTLNFSAEQLFDDIETEVVEQKDERVKELAEKLEEMKGGILAIEDGEVETEVIQDDILGKLAKMKQSIEAL